MNELRAGAPIKVAGMSLVPIEWVQVIAEKQPYGYWLNATKEAVAVLICESKGPRLMNVGVQEYSFNDILTHLPELKSFCQNHSELTS